MATLAFDSLRVARRLQKVGGPAVRRSGAPVPEPQADVLAELMVEAFGFYANSIQHLTRLTVRTERTQFVHSWILGIGVTALVIPQLNAWWA